MDVFDEGLVFEKCVEFCLLVKVLFQFNIYSCHVRANLC